MEQIKQQYTIRGGIGISFGCYILATAWRLIENQHPGAVWIILGIFLALCD